MQSQPRVEVNRIIMLLCIKERNVSLVSIHVFLRVAAASMSGKILKYSKHFVSFSQGKYILKVMGFVKSSCVPCNYELLVQKSDLKVFVLQGNSNLKLIKPCCVTISRACPLTIYTVVHHKQKQNKNQSSLVVIEIYVNLVVLCE